MTAILTDTAGHQPLPGMVGWDIVADLTPPELITLRRVAVLRRRILTGLVALVALCVAAYALAVVQHSRAAAESDAADEDTGALIRSSATYAPITQIETAVAQLNAQVASVMGDDVDVPATLANIHDALPDSMSMAQVSVVLTAAGSTAGSTAGSESGTTGLDATGHPIIGTLTISGSGRSLDDLPTFVDRLSQVKGVVNVLPTSNQVTDGAAQFNVTASLTNQLLTHRYDVEKTKP